MDTSPGLDSGDTSRKATTDDLTGYKAQKELDRSRHLVREQAGKIRDLERVNRDLTTRVDLLERIDSIVPAPPRWAKLPTAKGSIHRAIPTLMLSDCHWDEVVNPNEVEGVNKYDRRIAILRLKKVLAGAVDVTRKYLAGLTYEGLVLFLGGDCLSGNIHEELQQTNEDTVFGSLDFWSDQLTAFVSSLADEFGKVHVAGVVGNHGRNTRKPRAKQRVRDNLDWLLYRVVARALKGDSRVTWQIPESADCQVQIYGTDYNLTHGDQFRGGAGISGMMAPLMLGRHRKVQRQMSIHRAFTWLVMGHFHDYFTGKGLMVNGSVKGYDEYAYISNFSFQEPIQSLFVTTPERGLTFPVPIFCMDRKAEGW